MPKISTWFVFLLLGLNVGGLAQPGQILIPRIEAMPGLPQPLEIRNWSKVARDYDQLVFDPERQGQYLPLIAFAQPGHYNYSDNQAILLDTYVGSKYHHNQAEAINIMPAIIGATLAGIDKSNQKGINYVSKVKDFFNLKNGQKLYLNNYYGVTGDDWWYEVMPNVFFLQLKKLYPQCYPEADEHLQIISRQWLLCINTLGGKETPWNIPQMNYRAFNFKTLKPLTTGVPEPEAAGAIAWILFNTYEQTGNKQLRIAAEQALEFLNQLNTNPAYEIQLAYGVAAAARMNAKLGTDYNIAKLLGWCFDKGPLRGWGAIKGIWGGFDVSGLIGEVWDNEESGYAFSMNGFQQAGALAPVAKYDKRFARSLARWLLNLTNASRLFYSNALPPDQQDSYTWAQPYDTSASIPYEALKAPWQNWPIFAKGDALAGGWANTNLSLYSGSSVGYLAAIVQKTNQEGILRIDLNATDWFASGDLPAFVFYNPYPETKSVFCLVPENYDRIYESLTESHFEVHTSDTFYLSIPPDEARLIRYYRSSDSLAEKGNQLWSGLRVLDYNYHYNYDKPLRIKSLGVKNRTILRGTPFTAWCNAGNIHENPSYQWMWGKDTIPGSAEISLTAPADTGMYVLGCKIESGNETAFDTLHLHIVAFLPEKPVIDSIATDRAWYQKGSEIQARIWSQEKSPEIKWNSPSLVFTDDTGFICQARAPYYDTACWLRVMISNKYGITTLDSIPLLVKDTTQVIPSPLIWLPFSNADSNVVSNSLQPFSFDITYSEDPRALPQQAARFAGSSSYIKFYPDPLLNFREPLTLSAWISPENAGIERYIVSHGSWQGRFKLSLLPNKKLRFTVNTDSGIKDLDSQHSIELNQYVHATAVFSGYSLEIYLNGILNRFIPFTGGLNATDMPLVLGRMFENTSEFSYKGQLDEFRLYNGLLQPNHIKNLPLTWNQNPQENSNINIFPVPCTPNENIQIKANQKIEKVEVFDTQGRLFATGFKHLSPVHAALPAPGQSGIFLLKVRFADGTESTGKIVVLR
ncbi:MAG: LamG-like jellyroll fold domain-containing protein [Bacteroidales bacterium]